MCARYSLITPVVEIVRLFNLPLDTAPRAPRYNIAPTQQVPVVVSAPGGRALRDLRWGLIPFWAKDASKPMINARSETAAEKPTFRGSMRHRRCLVPADGFYEWQGPAGKKQPFLFSPPGGGPLAFAGLWERWTGSDGAPLDTFAILTTAANAVVAPVHDRMPVILPPDAWAAWLDPATTDAAALRPLLVPAPDELLTARPLSKHVSSVRNDDPACWT